MRPQPGCDALVSSARPRSRKSSVDHAAGSSSKVPTAFFMKREEDLEQGLAASSSTEGTKKSRDSTFGVQSLADTLEAAFGPESSVVRRRTGSSSHTKDFKKTASRAASHGSSTGSAKPLEGSKPSAARKSKRKLSTSVASIPLPLSRIDVPSSIPASAMPSTPGSVSLHSIKLSDEDSALDDVASQAIASSSDEDEDVDTQHGASSSFPQLVMPRIQMPTRRPFTTKGKAMGKLRVLVAGKRGVGKTSLIRSIVQACEDIVHVDPLSPFQSFSQSPPPKSRARKKKAEHTGTTQVVEIHASTKPYPHWWTEAEETMTSRRRKSSIDVVLERNICFVDTPGISEGSQEKGDMNVVVEYLESLLYQTSSVTSLEDNDILGVISGSGGVSVDLVLYLLPPNQDVSKDIEFMQHLSTFTNIIPLIAKSDTLSASDVVALKTSLLARLQTTSIRPFFFGKALDDALLAVQSLPIVHATSSADTPAENRSEPSQYPFMTPTYPHAISSTLGPDNDNMDASLLMSPDYVQPLVTSELGSLVNQIFDPESIAWLRHSAAKKFLAWRRRTELPGDSLAMSGFQRPRSPRTTTAVGLNGNKMNSSASSSIFSAASPSGVLVPRSASPFYPSNLQSPLLASSASLANSDTIDHPADFSLARYGNYSQGEHRLAEVRIAKWATDLQRSLRNERNRFEELQRNDRAKWLLERVGEEVSRGTIVTSPGGSPRADWAVVRHGDDKVRKASQQFNKAAGLDSRDPLGLCDFSDEVKRRGFVLVKVLGGVSVLGAVVVGVVRACGMETGLPQGGWWSCVSSWLTGGLE